VSAIDDTISCVTPLLRRVILSDYINWPWSGSSYLETVSTVSSLYDVTGERVTITALNQELWWQYLLQLVDKISAYVFASPITTATTAIIIIIIITRRRKEVLGERKPPPRPPNTLLVTYKSALPIYRHGKNSFNSFNFRSASLCKFERSAAR